MVSLLGIVLVEPEIPQNTGNIARTCACLGAQLHLVEPMGFRLTSKQMQRAGCDYWDKVEVVRWPCAEAFFEAHATSPLHLFAGRAQRSLYEATFGADDLLVFGRESRGLDECWLEEFASACVRIPMVSDVRSLNLSNAVAIGAYEAVRQQNLPGLV